MKSKEGYRHALEAWESERLAFVDSEDCGLALTPVTRAAFACLARDRALIFVLCYCRVVAYVRVRTGRCDCAQLSCALLLPLSEPASVSLFCVKHSLRLRDESLSTLSTKPQISPASQKPGPASFDCDLTTSDSARGSARARISLLSHEEWVARLVCVRAHAARECA